MHRNGGAGSLKRETSRKKPATPGFLLKQPALAVALWPYRLEFRGLYSCCDAFSAERPVCAICGHFKGEPVQKAERPTGKKKPAKSCRTCLEGTHSQLP